MRGALSAVADRAIRRLRWRSFAVVFDLEGPNKREVGHVLAALRDYCRAQTETVGLTVEETYRLNGRRDVWLFIQQVLNFDETQIRDLVEVSDEYFSDGE